MTMREKARFTIDGDEGLENHLARVCDQVVAGVRSLIPAAAWEGVLLGGGYGRGEGGVLQTEAGGRPYNDLEFYLLLRGNCRVNQKKYGAALHRLAHELEKEAGIEVEFKILSQRKLERSPPGMFYYDLVAGHRLLRGEENLLQNCAHHLAPQNIPLSEATRLLMNRCSGLLFSLARLMRPEFDHEAADFVGRNQAKAQLAFGDVLLTTHGQYHSSCRERLRRLEQLDETAPFLSEARKHHARGVEFKLHPQRSNCSRAELFAHQARLVAFALELWLWLESRRLGRSFSSAWEYAASPVNKCPETNPWRNAAINLANSTTTKIFRYPRERLLESLAVLLWEPEKTGDPARRKLLQQRLGGPSSDFHGWVEAYAALWRHYN